MIAMTMRRCSQLQRGRADWETPAYGVVVGEAEAKNIWPRIGGEMLGDDSEVVQPVRLDARVDANSRGQVARSCLQRALDDGGVCRQDGGEGGVRADGGLEERVGHFEGIHAAGEERVQVRVRGGGDWRHGAASPVGVKPTGTGGGEWMEGVVGS